MGAHARSALPRVDEAALAADIPVTDDYSGSTSSPSFRLGRPRRTLGKLLRSAAAIA